MIGCQACNTLWVAEDLHSSSTTECPQCARAHQTKNLRALATSDDVDVARELRSRILAERAGHLEEYLEEDDYGVLADRVDEAESWLDNLFESNLSDTVGEHRDVYADLAAPLLEPDRTFEAFVDFSMEEHRDKFQRPAEEVLGNVVTVDDQLDQHYGRDRDPVTLNVEEDESGLIGSAEEDTGSLKLSTVATEFADMVVHEPTNARGLHQELFATDSPLQGMLLEAAGALADEDGGKRNALITRLEQVSGDHNSAGGSFVSLIVDALDGGNVFAFKKLVSQLGGNTFLDVRTGLPDIYHGPFALLRAVDVTPKIVVRLTADLFDTDSVARETRENLIEYLTELGRACDVRLIGTGLVQTRLIQEHRELLPISVIESSVARLATHQLSDDAKTLAVDALAAIKYSDTAWDVLHVICEGRTDSAHYCDLRNDQRLNFGRSRLSQCLSTLEDHDLILTEGPQNDKYAIATQAGTAALESLEAQIGKQADLDKFGDAAESEGVSETPNCCADPCTPADSRGEGSASGLPAPKGGSSATAGGSSASAPQEQARSAVRNYSEGFAAVEMLDRWEHEATVAAAPAGGVGFDDVPIGGVNTEAFAEWSVGRLDDKRSPIYSFDTCKDELVVGAEWHQPLQFGVALARSLLSPAAFQQVLTVDRLDGKAGDLDALLDGDKAALRDKRCLAWLKQAYSAEEYRGALQKAVSRLTDLTHDVNTGEFSDEQRVLRREILQLAHGLIGTAVGIYDLLDVDVTRVVRVPGRFSSNMGPTDRENLRHFMVRASTISSIMGAYTQSRVQFETDEQKRESIGAAPEVDMADPTGTHIGQWTLVGHGVTEFRDELAHALSHPEDYDLELQTDAKNYQDWVLEMPLEDSFRRECVAQAVTRSLRNRSIRPTRHAVSVMQAFTGSVHDVAKALYYLGSENDRKVRVDDLKFALSRLPTSRILPSARGSTKSKVVSALICSAMPLSQRDLVERAGVTAQSFRNNRDELEAFGVIRETKAGWVVCLTYRDVDFDDVAEDGVADALPWFAVLDEESHSRDRTRATAGREESVQGVLYEAMLVLESLETVGNPDHPVAGAMYGVLTPEDFEAVLENRPSYSVLVRFACALLEHDPNTVGSTPPDEGDVGKQIGKSVAVLGRVPDQSSVASFEGRTPAVASD